MTSYYLLVFLLFIIVYFLPGLALAGHYPKIIKAGIFQYIPYLSLCFWFLTITLLQIIDLYKGIAVYLIVGILFLFSIYTIIKNKRFLHIRDILFLLISFLVILPLFIGWSTRPFYIDDEAYSWNYWALQHFNSESPSWYYTEAPYPQFLPKIMSLIYHLVANFEWELPVKAVMGLSHLLIYSSMATFCYYKTKSVLLSVVSVLIFNLIYFRMPGNEGYLLRAGYADGLMAVFFIASVLALHRYISSKDRLDIFTCTFCAVAAAYTKQPALLWSLFSLPVILCSLASLKKENIKPLILSAAFSVGFSLLWILFIGAGFENNQGVINRSLSTNTYFSTFIQSFTTYFIDESKVGIVIFLAMVICILQRGIYLAVLLLFIVPAIIAWFVLGSYEIRLGYHIILLAISYLAIYLVLAIYEIRQNQVMQKPRIALLSKSLGVLILLFIVVSIYHKGSAIFQAQLAYSQTLFAENIDFRLSKDAYLRIIFENGSAKAKEIYDSPSQQNILIGTNYVHQAFYIKHNVYRLDPKWSSDLNVVLKQIESNNIDYTISSDFFITGRLRESTNGLKRICSQLFEEVLGRQTNHFQIYIDKVHKDRIKPCLELLHEK